MRTFQEPLRSPGRTKFQPCAVGIIKTGVDVASISKLLPGNQLRNINIVGPPNHDLNDSHRLARFSNAHNSKHGIFESDNAGQLLELLRRKAERRAYVLQIFEWRIVGGPIDPVGTAPQEQKAVDQAFCHPRQGEQHVARSPGEIDWAGALESKIFVPARSRSELLPALDLLEL